MQFEWDERKRRANIDKHRLDFIDAELVFLGPHHTLPSLYRTEERWITVGILDGREVAVIWTERGEAIRIISFRRARREERRAYRQLHQ